MQTFLINLDRAPNRLSRMQEAFERAGLNFVRVPGVDGSLLTEQEIRTLQPEPGDFGWLTNGEVGCFLSHRLCWELIAEGPSEYAAVFEDDIVLSADAAHLLREVSWIPRIADIVKLDTSPFRVYLDRNGLEAPRGKKLHRLCFVHYGTGGYIISKRAAASLLKESGTIRAPVDEFMFNVISPVFRLFRLYQMVSPLCTHEQYLTPPLSGEPETYIEGRRSKHRMKRSRKLVRELYSGLNRVCSWIGIRYRRIVEFE